MTYQASIISAVAFIVIVYFILQSCKARAVVKELQSGTDDEQNFKMLLFILQNQLKIKSVEINGIFLWRLDDKSQLSIMPAISGETFIIAYGTEAEDIAQRHFGTDYHTTSDGKIWTILLEDNI